MATHTVTTCDVTGGTRKVERYRVIVQVKAGPNLSNIEWDPEEVKATEVDLCPAALSRLKHFIDRGTTPPINRKTPRKRASTKKGAKPPPAESTPPVENPEQTAG